MQISDFVSDVTGQPAALWHVAYADRSVGEEDLEEFELREAVAAYVHAQAANVSSA